MISEDQTNMLYLADCLPVKFPQFYSRFNHLLKTQGIQLNLLPGTKDVWVRDYMPVQTSADRFIQFRYDPDYLKPKKYWKTISDYKRICENIRITTFPCELVVDGGNVVKHSNKAILCDKVFCENPDLAPVHIIQALEHALNAEIIIVPSPPNDFTGHSDGVVRFLDHNTVLVNRYADDDNIYSTMLLKALAKKGFNTIEIPYNPYRNTSFDDATGIYLNYLQIQGFVFLPVFNIAEDEIAVRAFEKLFPNEKVITVKSNEIAKEGGVLNCISWSIFKHSNGN